MLAHSFRVWSADCSAVVLWGDKTQLVESHGSTKLLILWQPISKERRKEPEGELQSPKSCLCDPLPLTCTTSSFSHLSHSNHYPETHQPPSHQVTEPFVGSRGIIDSNYNNRRIYLLDFKSYYRLLVIRTVLPEEYIRRLEGWNQDFRHLQSN